MDFVRRYVTRPWPDGPWMKEPDIITFTHNSFKCGLVRHPERGYWRGYVEIPQWHWLWRMQLLEADLTPTPELAGLKVHGGVTHAGPAEQMDGWCVGFSCDHGWDTVPARGAIGIESVYRKAMFAREQLEQLAMQL